MGISSFPGGFQNGVLIRGLPIQSTHPGEIFYVNNSGVIAEGGIGGSDRNKGTYLQPFATINHAISKCTASRGDIIMIMPGHQETVSTSGGIDLNVAGVAIMGLGTYDSRPKIIYTTDTLSSVDVTADNCTMYNMVFEAASATVNAIDINAVGCTLSYLSFQEQSTSVNFLVYIHIPSTTDNTADGLYVSHCTGHGISSATSGPMSSNGNIEALVVENCHFNIDNSVAGPMVDVATGKSLTNCRITHNHYQTLKTSGTLFVSSDTATNDGVIAYNTTFHLDPVGEVNIDCTGAGLFENYASGAFDVQGYLTPVADS